MEISKRYSRKHIREEYIINSGHICKVIDGGSKHRYCTIQINDWTTEVLCYHLKTGNIKYPYHQSICGKRYIGEGKYKITIDGKKTKAYTVWCDMIKRCYNYKFQVNHYTYTGCTVCDEWLCFQNFAKWFEENYVELKGIKLDLDKDLMVEGNKIYSPNTCQFIPHYANIFLINKQKTNTSGYTGVHWDKHSRKYISKIKSVDDNINLCLGCFDDKLEASKAYIKERKNQCIKMYYKLINDGITDQAILNKFKSGNL